MYSVRLARRAERGLRRIREGDPRGYQRVAAAIRSLADDPRPLGDYRIVYEVDDDRVLVIVVNVPPRGEVYR